MSVRRQERAIEQRILTRGAVVALCLAALAAGIAPIRLWPPVVEWFLDLLRDGSFAASGFVLVCLGIRRVRRHGRSFRTLVYPIAGFALLAALFVLAVATYLNEWSLVVSLSENVQAEHRARLEALSRMRFVWPAIAAFAALLGILSRVRETAA